MKVSQTERRKQQDAARRELEKRMAEAQREIDAVDSDASMASVDHEPEGI